MEALSSPMTTPPRPTEPATAGPASARERRSQHPPLVAAAPQKRERAVLFELKGAHPGAVYSLGLSGASIGRRENSDVHLDDGTVSLDHALLTRRDGAIHIEDLRSLNGTFVNERRVEREIPLSDGDYVRLGSGGTIFRFSMMDEFEESALRNLFQLALRDPLTQLHNRQYFEERLLGEVSSSRRLGSALSLVLVDIDKFKTTNEEFGHEVGDAILKLVAQSIQKIMLPEDVLSRIAGDEFAIIARSMSSRNLEILCERISHRVQTLSLEPAIHGLTATVTVGFASMGPGQPEFSVHGLLASARRSLSGAKARNQSVGSIACSGPG
jgi:diguanylate cyclase (GGDEF)-like protein